MRQRVEFRDRRAFDERWAHDWSARSRQSKTLAIRSRGCGRFRAARKDSAFVGCFMNEHRPAIVAVSGLSSNTGKTTLVCELIKRLPGWEAIKLTRGHYRSCGKDPNGCCVSDLLQDEPLI